MKELLTEMIKALVDKPDEVDITLTESENTKIYELRLGDGDVGKVIGKKGHRIRLDISSSNFPRFDVNPNTGEPIGKHTRTEIANNSLYTDAEHPSHVVLPVIPSK